MVANDIIFALWFFLPAGLANMAPVLVAKLPLLRKMNAPLDFGATFKGKRLFGANKTWRGLAAGIAAAVFVVWLQQHLMREYGWFSVTSEEVGYLTLPAALLGLLFALGALGADAIESFFKRQRGIKPGGVWFPFDVVDHIIGAILVTMPLVLFSLGVYLVVVLIWAVANLSVSYLGYFISLKERPI